MADKEVVGLDVDDIEAINICSSWLLRLKKLQDLMLMENVGLLKLIFQACKLMELFPKVLCFFCKNLSLDVLAWFGHSVGLW